MELAGQAAGSSSVQSRGRTCAKGPATINQIHDTERILKPLKRQGKRGSGEFVEVSCEEALDAIGVVQTVRDRSLAADRSRSKRTNSWAPSRGCSVLAFGAAHVPETERGSAAPYRPQGMPRRSLTVPPAAPSGM
jgi:hypothetical protein